MSIQNLVDTDLVEDAMGITASGNEHYNGNDDQGIRVSGPKTADTIQPGSFTAAEWHEASMQYLEHTEARWAAQQSAKFTVLPSVPDQPKLRTDHEEKASLRTAQDESSDAHGQESVEIFIPDPANKDIIICQICQKPVHRRHISVHSTTQKHQRLSATSRTDRAFEPAKEPQYFCEVCQRSVRQSYLLKHEATDLHHRRLVKQMDLPVAPAPKPAVGAKVPKHKKTYEWTAEEDETIVRAYVDLKDDEGIAGMLPYRSVQAVAQRRRDLTNPRPTVSGSWEYSALYLRILWEKNGVQRNKPAL
ncbi:hypothetical protein P171DRAFT_438854 [Karstenula rhodostoma CBS 690.94]|uniref:Uncharacterized protein n=1 Tax=Karstenula rhodostoma CBS 690.94 TaxID=1392251 RepID=A0A9P4PRV0_9PLEO|nr:hypothetical protein P171DRAFT_438854 [Karstenula rhodostoma CBS 690.94]